MSFTCMNCGTSPATGNRLCSQRGLTFDQPVPAVQAPRITPSSSALPSHAENARRFWLALLLVMGIGFMGLMSAGCGTQSPPPPPPPPLPPVSTTGNLVGSWASDIVVGGSSQHWVYTFNGDGTMLEAVTSQAGQGGGSESYTSTGDQVTISDGKAYTEQGTVAWAGPDQFRYKITSNTADANQIGLETVFTRQSPVTPPGPPEPGTMTIDDLAQAYQNNEMRADSSYKGKQVTITGKIRNIIAPNGDGGGHGGTVVFDTSVVIGTGVWTIACDLSAENKGQLLPLNPGQVVTIQGVCTGRHLSDLIDLEECSVK